MKNVARHIFYAIFFIASQACLMLARAENSELIGQVFTGEVANAELAKIKQERLAIEAKSKEHESVCYKKFAVSSCLRDVKTEKLAALNIIKRQELDIKNQLRAKKAASEQSKNARSLQSQTTNQASSDTSDEKGNKQKAVTSEKISKNAKTLKAEKSAKSEAEIFSEKDAKAKARASAAQKRLADTNEKIAASQKKAQSKAIKNSQAGANAAKYKQKLLQAEEHKAEVEKSRLSKSSQSRPTSAPLPVPNAAELAR